MSASLELPSYLAQSPDVLRRFEKLRNRPGKLKVENLSKKFDTPNGEILALNKIIFKFSAGSSFPSLDLPDAETTLIRILAGLDFPSSGNVF